MIKKEQILDQYTEEEIFRHYIGHDFKMGVPFKSELQPENHPSANIFLSSKSGKALYKDFRRNDAINCFSYVMELFNADFKGSLAIIASDLGITDTIVQKKKTIKIPKMIMEKARSEFEYAIRPWESYDLSYWNSFGITSKTLNLYDVFPLYWFRTIKNDVIYPDVYNEDNNPIYLIKINEGVKIYRPFEEQRKKWLSSTRKGDVFGLKQLIEAAKDGKMKMSGILAGQKDVMSLYSESKIMSVALNSEGAKLGINLFIELNNNSEWIFVLYDNDKTGIINSRKMAKTYGISAIGMNQFLGYSMLTKDSDGINDISEWYNYMAENHLHKDRLFSLIIKTYENYHKNNSSN